MCLLVNYKHVLHTKEVCSLFSQMNTRILITIVIACVIRKHHKNAWLQLLYMTYDSKKQEIIPWEFALNKSMFLNLFMLLHSKWIFFKWLQVQPLVIQFKNLKILTSQHNLLMSLNLQTLYTKPCTKFHICKLSSEYFCRKNTVPSKVFPHPQYLFPNSPNICTSISNIACGVHTIGFQLFLFLPRMWTTDLMHLFVDMRYFK